MVACQAMSTGEIAQPAPRRRRSDGERSRKSILEAAAALATIDGLEGLSIGRLAERTGMSKSGLYAHFGSKQELQLATVETANEIFQAEVIEPALAAPAGRERLLALCDHYFSHLEREVFPGGCFFASAAADFDTRRARSGTRSQPPTPASTSCCRSLAPTRAVAASSPRTRIWHSSASSSAAFCSPRTPLTCSSGTPARSTRVGGPCAHVWPSEAARWLASGGCASRSSSSTSTAP